MPEEEQVLRRLYPSFHQVGATYLIAALLSVIVSAVLGAFGGSFLIVLLCAAIFFIYPIFRHIQRNHRVYTLTNTVIEIRVGVLRRTVRTIRAQHPARYDHGLSLQEAAGHWGCRC